MGHVQPVQSQSGFMPLVRVRRILSPARPQPRGSFEAGPVTCENVLALAIASESGTIISAIPGGLSSPPEGKRLAGAHLIFNVGTGLVALLFIHIFIGVVEWIGRSVVSLRAIPRSNWRSSTSCSARLAYSRSRRSPGAWSAG